MSDAKSIGPKVPSVHVDHSRDLVENSNLTKKFSAPRAFKGMTRYAAFLKKMGEKGMSATVIGRYTFTRGAVGRQSRAALSILKKTGK